MSRRVFLPQIPRWVLATAAVIGGVFYVASVVVGERLKADHPVVAQVLGDLLLAASGIVLGFSGVGALLERWQEWQLRQRTGGYVLTLLDEARHLAGRLVALTWEPVRPLLGEFRDPAADHVWELIQDPERGRHQVLDLHLHLHGIKLPGMDAGALPPVDPSVWSKIARRAAQNAHPAGDAANALHELVRELCEYQDVAAASLLSASAELRAVIRDWQEQADVGGNDASRIVHRAMGAATLAISPLFTIADGLDAAERASLAVLERTDQGRELAKDYAAKMTQRKQHIEASVDLAVISADIAEKSDELRTDLEELRQLLAQLRADDKQGRHGETKDEEDEDKPHTD